MKMYFWLFYSDKPVRIVCLICRFKRIFILYFFTMHTFNNDIFHLQKQRYKLCDTIAFICQQMLLPPFIKINHYPNAFYRTHHLYTISNTERFQPSINIIPCSTFLNQLTESNAHLVFIFY